MKKVTHPNIPEKFNLIWPRIAANVSHPIAPMLLFFSICMAFSPSSSCHETTIELTCCMEPWYTDKNRNTPIITREKLIPCLDFKLPLKSNNATIGNPQKTKASCIKSPSDEIITTADIFAFPILPLANNSIINISRQ